MAAKKQEPSPETVSLSMAAADHAALLDMAEVGVKAAVMQLLQQPAALRNIQQTTTEALRVIDAAKPQQTGQ